MLFPLCCVIYSQCMSVHALENENEGNLLSGNHHRSPIHHPHSNDLQAMHDKLNQSDGSVSRSGSSGEFKRHGRARSGSIGDNIMQRMLSHDKQSKADRHGSPVVVRVESADTHNSGNHTKGNQSLPLVDVGNPSGGLSRPKSFVSKSSKKEKEGEGSRCTKVTWYKGSCFVALLIFVVVLSCVEY